MAVSNTAGAVMAIAGVLIGYEALKLLRSSGSQAQADTAAGGAAAQTGAHAPFGAGTAVGQALQAAMSALGVPSADFDAYMQLIARENASGDPNATNPTPVGGQHATGPAQFLPSTFAQVRARHGLPPGDIHNIIDAYTTMILCVEDAYGHPENIPGLYSADYPGYHC